MSFYHDMRRKLLMTQRLVTRLLNTASGAQETWKSRTERLHKRTEVRFQCSTGPRSQRQVIQQCPRARGIKPSYDTTGCVYVRKTEKETDCGCRQGSQCETPVCTVTLLLFIDI